MPLAPTAAVQETSTKRPSRPTATGLPAFSGQARGQEAAPSPEPAPTAETEPI